MHAQKAANPATRRGLYHGRPFASGSAPPRGAGLVTAIHVTRQHKAPAATASPSSHSISAPARYAMSGLALAMVSTLLAAPALAADVASMHPASMPMEQFQLAENQEFFSNVARYGRYFVTVMLGTGYVMLRPLTNAFTKSPVSAILTTAGVIGAFVVVKFTLEAMLGIGNDPLPFEYVQGNF